VVRDVFRAKESVVGRCGYVLKGSAIGANLVSEYVQKRLGHRANFDFHPVTVFPPDVAGR
jgi:hypothetical protein